MASFKFEGLDQYTLQLEQLEKATDGVCEEMLNAGTKIVLATLKGANQKFAKYWRIKKPKRNQYGWYAQVLLKGTTSSGAPAALAGTVYEFGRGGKRPQPARPFARAAVKGVEAEVSKAMDEVYENEIKKAGL